MEFIRKVSDADWYVLVSFIFQLYGFYQVLRWVYKKMGTLDFTNSIILSTLLIGGYIILPLTLLIISYGYDGLVFWILQGCSWFIFLSGIGGFAIAFYMLKKVKDLDED